MSDFQAVITQAGLDAAVSANSSGINISITHVGAGTGRYSPTRFRTSLDNEISRVAVSGGSKPTSTQMHLTAEFSEGEFAATEVGFYLSDGTLFAVWSHPSNVLFYKTELGRVLQAFDLVLEALPANNITVNASGDLSLYYAPEFVQMVIGQTELATAHVQSSLRQIEFNQRLLKAGV